jgi:cyclase
MRRVRIIPILLLREGGVVKSVQFKKHVYVGDPINAVKIFNEKGVDEICILDIDATAKRRGPDLDLIGSIASEAFMPLSYGGGLTTVDQMKAVMQQGVEKIVLNSAALDRPELVSEAARVFGSQSVVVSIDAKRGLFGGYKAHGQNGTKASPLDPVAHAKRMEQAGAGEIVLCSIDRDGTFKGYDLELVSSVAHAVDIPVVACGGAASVGDFALAVKAGASALAAGSMFVFVGKHRAVLINYPREQELQKLFEVA